MKFPFRLLLAVSLLVGSVYVKAEEPRSACLVPYLGTSDETVDAWLKPFFGGTNSEQNNGCQNEGQLPKTVCVPRALNFMIERGNTKSRETFAKCPDPKPPFQNPFTNQCHCNCKHFSDTYCWGDELSTFQIANEQ